jgi:Tol biopolymer transport system component
MRCSPDGLRLRFTLNDEKTNSHSLWEINTDGRNAHSLLAGSNDPLDACCGVWTSDGKYYVFQTHSRSGRKDLWVLPEGRSWSAKRKGLTKLTNGPLAFDSPQSSRDGQKLFAIGLQPRSELVRYDARSGFVPYLGGISAAGVAFSKGGEWFTYTSATDGTLWRAKTDGSERFQLSYPPMDVIVPRWSPDGKQIAFSGTLPKKPRNSYLISSSGGVPQQIVPEAFTSSDPNWSPDGKSIVLWLADSGFINKRISIVDLASGKETRLPASEHLFSPRWSPDGRYIAAIAEDEQELVVFDRSTQQWVSLAKKRIGYPSWSHHGDFVYFDTLGENPAFFRVRISDLRLERLIDLKGSRRFWSVWEPWSGLAPDDSLLLQRDTSMEEIYALEWRTQ